MIDLYSIDGWVTTLCDPLNKTIFVKWFNYTSPVHVRKSLEAQTKAMDKFGVLSVIVDSSEAKGLPYPQDYHWFSSTLYPECKKFGLKLVIVIYPKNPIARLVTRDWVLLGEKFNLSFVKVKNMTEALRCARNLGPLSTLVS